MTNQTKPKVSECVHDYQEDPDFASGMVGIISGTPSDMGEETRMVCIKCGDSKYVRVSSLGSLLDMLEKTI